MGERVSYELKRLLRERKIVRIRADRKLVLKEVEGAKSDLEDARDSLAQRKFKWATIQGYYCMFHSARALLYSRGFREKSHYALLIAIRELFGSELGRSLIDKFEEGMDLRQEADYGLKFSDVGAVEVVESAEAFLKKVCQILKVA
jgi:uncharacterized protein (UPF0332 family)